MATKDLASQILGRLQSGVNDLYESMKRRLAASDARYDAEIRAADAALTEEKNRAVGEARVRLSNDLDRLADRGLTASGGAVQTRLAHNAALAKTVSALTASAAAKKENASLEKARAAAELRENTDKAAASLRASLWKNYLDQLNADRTYALAAQKASAELQVKARQVAVQEEKLRVQKAQAALASLQASAKAAGGSAAEGSSGALTPSKSPYEYFKEVVARYTRRDPDNRRYKIVDRTRVSRTLRAIVEDPGVDPDYRRELYLYARSMGYTY